MKTFMLFLVAVITGLPLEVFGQVEPLSSLYHFYDDVVDVQIQGDYAYLATNGTGLSVLEISDLDNPEIVGNLRMDAVIQAVILNGEYAVIMHSRGISSVDISNPVEPELLWNYYLFEPSEISMYENLCCVTACNFEEDDDDMNDGYYISDIILFDLTSPQAPDTLWSYHSRIAGIDDIVHGLPVLTEDILVVSKSGWWHIYDISDPARPETLSITNFTDSPNTIDHQRQILYFDHYDYDNETHYIRLVDISDPTSPEVITDWDIFPEDYRRDCHDIILDGTMVYLQGPRNEIIIIDAEDVENPEILSVIEPEKSVIGIATRDDLLVIVEVDNQLEFYDISDSLNPDRLSLFDHSGHARGIHVSGNYLYLAADDEGLMIADVSDPENPVHLGQFYTENSARSVYVNGGNAYVSELPFGLSVIDISDPTDPELISRIDSIDVLQVWASGDGTLYTIIERIPWNLDEGLMIYNLEDPENPSVLERFRNAQVFQIEDSLMFVGFPYDQMLVYDIADTRQPTLIDSINTGRLTPTDPFFLTDDYLVTTLWESQDEYSWRELRILNISDYENPELLETEFPSSNTIFFFQYPHLLINDWRYAQIYDFSAIEHPQKIWETELVSSRYAQSMFLQDSIVYVSQWENVQLYDCSDVLSAPSADFTLSPSSFTLLEAYPNPFNSSTTIRFTIPRAGQVSLTMYDIMGRRVRDLTPAGWFEAGEHRVVLDGKGLASGVYVIRPEGNNANQVTLVELLR